VLDPAPLPLSMTCGSQPPASRTVARITCPSSLSRGPETSASRSHRALPHISPPCGPGSSAPSPSSQRTRELRNAEPGQGRICVPGLSLDNYSSCLGIKLGPSPCLLKPHHQPWATIVGQLCEEACRRCRGSSPP
jgi:hypothetical protein